MLRFTPAGMAQALKSSGKLSVATKMTFGAKRPT
jgi:hypothetical protein